MEKTWKATAAHITFMNEGEEKLKTVGFTNLVEHTTGDQINSLAVNVANLCDSQYIHTVITTKEIVKAEI